MNGPLRRQITKTYSCAFPPLLQGGKTIRDICTASGATTIDLSRSDGTVRISGPTQESITKAQSLVLLLAGETAPGTIIRQARVERVSPFGAFVEVAPSRVGLVHVSEVDVTPVRNVEEVLKVRVFTGQRQPKCSGIRKRGR
jgi:polyribonucleotide nucleotidyltransferase